MADLNGAWLGTYWQQGVPSRFEAVFVQSGNALSGSILDDNYLGEAQISGEVKGRSISFTKRYLITSPAAIKYIGTLSENDDYIQGQWKIGRRNFGRWEARRSGEDLMAELKARIQQQIPQKAG
ncbi:hypothetical protein BV372_20530 [Nostoc sp. T09]|uniref:hypothetical protein n=1 Tax=Nostoc sp. T09 TaxID=1932621 RepID=UPI000A378BC7|nr:hypothetical protein [Nostoc sp. T09]OUL31241.1 hypothetical protein BV372_20530 [Nostoc sp. T09]